MEPAIRIYEEDVDVSSPEGYIVLNIKDCQWKKAIEVLNEPRAAY